MKKILLPLLLCAAFNLFAGEKQIDLVNQLLTVDILVDTNDQQTIHLCAELFSDDIYRVSGKRAMIKHSSSSLSKNCVIVGTIEHSKVIKELIKRKKIDVRQVEGQWESALVQIVENPFDGVDRALVIAGSDRRGAAYALLDISKRIGVSPWYYFADVTPTQKESITITQDRYIQKSPSVKYRGIFINDETWGIRPWAAKTLAPHEGKGLGPTTYSKIFELLLRLKANTIWPAMQQQTIPFNEYEENKVVADKYGIVMGASHIEPMLRNSIGGGEWDREYPGQDYNYVTNKKNVYQYWEKALISNGKYENIYTLGKRGKDDAAGNEITVDVLNGIISDQRDMIRRHVDKDISDIAQTIVFYTEVLNLYNEGIKIPDDVILCWPDDNFGNMRQLPNLSEQKRKGGSGLYYHFQYLCWDTSAYAWLYSSPLAQTWYEMKKAYDYNVRKFWIVNVGDIKPAEIAIEHFMAMGWDMSKFEESKPHEYLTEWASYTFGERYAERIADIYMKHTQLGYTRRPENMVMYNYQLKDIKYDWFSLENYNDEAQNRIDEYDKLSRQAEEVYDELPSHLKDAFFQMVLYNVKGAAQHNKKVLYAQKSLQYGSQRRASAARYAMKAQQAEDAVHQLIDHYCTGLVTVGSKWNHMAAIPGPWGLPGSVQWRQWDMPPLSSYSGDGSPILKVSNEGGDDSKLPCMSIFNRDRRFIDLYNTGNGCLYWSATSSANWIKISESEGRIWDEKRIWIDIDWENAPKGESIVDELTINWHSSINDFWIDYEKLTPEEQKLYQEGKLSKLDESDMVRVKVAIFNPMVSGEVKGFVESNGYISMEAENFSRKGNSTSAQWDVIEGIGRSGNSISLFPTTTPAITDIGKIKSKSPYIEYDIYTFSTGNAELILNCSSSIPINRDYKLRVAYSIDDQDPILIDCGSDSRDIISNLLQIRTEMTLPDPGQHRLRIWAVDPGVVVDKIILNSGGLKESYLGPKESLYHR